MTRRSDGDAWRPSESRPGGDDARRPSESDARRLSESDAWRLSQCLAADGVALVPTDTVYGLACNPQSAAAVRRIYELKRRPPRKPSAVMFFDLAAALEALPELGDRTRAALAALLPGPVTLLLANPNGRFPLACEGGLLGLRVPVFRGGLAALTAVEVPAMQSSANESGGTDPRRLGDVPARLRKGVDLVLDGGELPGSASTVVDLSDYERAGSWRVVREGPLSWVALSGVLDAHQG
jgi:L-threonylcarbamoyladenylate synthase